MLEVADKVTGWPAPRFDAFVTGVDHRSRSWSACYAGLVRGGASSWDAHAHKIGRGV